MIEKLRLVSKILALTLDITADTLGKRLAKAEKEERFYSHCIDILKQKRRNCFKKLFGGAR